MNFNEVQQDIETLMKDAQGCSVSTKAEADLAANSIIICSRMRNAMEGFASSLKAAGDIYKAKVDAWTEKNYKASKEAPPEPQKEVASEPAGFSLDDFDEEPADEADELAAEIKRTQNDMLF